MGNSPHSSHVEGFALGRLVEPLTFNLRSAGPQEGQYDPRPRYPDGTLVQSGFKTGSNRGRPTGTALGIGHTAQTKAQIVERYKAGEGLQVLAAAFSTTAQRVREIVVQAGVTIRPFGQQKKTNEQRSNDMAKIVETQPEQIRQIHERYMAGESLIACVAGQGLSVSTAINRFKEMGLKYPRPKTAVMGLPPRLARNAEPVAEAAPGPGDEAMDDPTPDAAAKTQTEPATELMWKQIQERARELRERVIADTRVIAVQELPSPISPMLARKQYHPPRILESGSMLDVMNPHAAAKLVEGLVSRLNEVPGVQAYFEWRASGSVGQPLGR